MLPEYLELEIQDLIGERKILKNVEICYEDKINKKNVVFFFYFVKKKKIKYSLLLQHSWEQLEIWPKSYTKDKVT